MAERTVINAASGDFVAPPDEFSPVERTNPFPPLEPSELPALFERPGFRELPYEKRREALSNALSAVYDFTSAQPDFEDAHSSQFGQLATRAYAKLDEEHTLGEKTGEAGKWFGGFVSGMAKDIGTAALSAASLPSRMATGYDPTRGSAEAIGYGFGVGSARYIDHFNHIQDKWTSDSHGELKSSLSEVRQQIDEGKAPVTDSAAFVGWLRDRSAKTLVPQNKWTAFRLGDYGINDPQVAFGLADANQLAAPQNAGLVAAYIKSRDPHIWEQLEKNLATTPLAAALGDEAKAVTQSESGKWMDSTFGKGASEHLLSTSDPLVVLGYLIPGARAAALGKAVAKAEGGIAARAAIAGKGIAAGLPEQAVLGGVMTVGHDPEATPGEVVSGAANMMAAGAVMHGAGVAVGEGVRGVRAARERFAPPPAGDNGPYAPTEPPIPPAEPATPPIQPQDRAGIEAAPTPEVRGIVEEVVGRAAETRNPADPTPVIQTDVRSAEVEPVAVAPDTAPTTSLPLTTPEAAADLAVGTTNGPGEVFVDRTAPNVAAVPLKPEAVAVETSPTAGEKVPSGRAQPAEAVASNPFDTAATSARLRALDDSKPRPTEKLYGKNATPEQRTSQDTKIRQWNNERRKALKDHKEMVAKSNDWLRTAPAEEGKAFGADWTRATERLEPEPVAAEKAVAAKPSETADPYYSGVPIPKFPIRKVTELDTATGSRSSRLQQSTQETTKAQKDIKKAVPSAARREAIAVWREAGGDEATLAGWQSAAKQEWMRDAAKTAQSLTPEEIVVARGVADVFDRMEARGRSHDVLGGHRDNYIPHVWKLDDPAKGFGTRSLKKRFAFAKARTLNTFFDGDQAGFKPRTLDVADLVPGYIAEMNRVIADRQFVRDMVGKKSKEGTPLVIPRGRVTTKQDAATGAVSHLVFPNAENMAKDAAGNAIDQSAYKVMEGQPALRSWKWSGKDTEGNPIFIEGDLALHPEAYRRIHAMFGESKVRKWYRDTEGSMQTPKAIARALDITQGVIKREMFGLLPPFHQVQEGTHAIGHLVNPFWGLKEFDLASPVGKDAAQYTMLLSDKTSGRQYFEGVGAHKTLVSMAARKFGGKAGEAIAEVVEGYQKYIFGSYIPRLKFNTYEKILERNTKRFADELKSGEVSAQDIKLLSGQQTDAAYGHLNYAMLDRSPTVQHFMQLGMLAPDFLEARVRFVAQALKSVTSKTGNEQFKAIAVLAVAQAAISATMAQLTGGEWEPTHPFEFTHNGRRYTMRSVPEDAMRALAFLGGDTETSRQFVSGRINPLAQTGVQLLEGRNYRGEKVGPLETLGELGAKFIPMTARSLPFVRELTETSRNAPTSSLEQFMGSVGLKISRHSPISETHKLANKWMEDQDLEQKSTSFPTSKYKQLRYALEDSDLDKAADEFAELAKTMTPGKIRAGFRESISHPFTKSQAMDKEFRKSLDEHDGALYDLAQKKRADILARFMKVKEKK